MSLTDHPPDDHTSPQAPSDIACPFCPATPDTPIDLEHHLAQAHPDRPTTILDHRDPGFATRFPNHV